MNVRATYQDGIAAARRVIENTPDLKLCQQLMWTIIDEVGDILSNGLQELDYALFGADQEALEATELLLASCFADLVSAANCLDQGIPHSATIILRPVSESIGVALALSDPAQFDLYKNRPNQFSAPKAVSRAKDMFPQLGPHYGALTKLATHPGYPMLGRAIYEQNGEVFLALLPPVERMGGVYQIMASNSVALTAIMIGEAFELSFARSLKSLRYFKIEEGQLVSVRSGAGIQALLEIAGILERKFKSTLPRN